MILVPFDDDDFCAILAASITRLKQVPTSTRLEHAVKVMRLAALNAAAVDAVGGNISILKRQAGE